MTLTEQKQKLGNKYPTAKRITMNEVGDWVVTLDDGMFETNLTFAYHNGKFNRVSTLEFEI